MSQRLTVRFAYQRGWQVVDGSAILITFDKKEDATERGLASYMNDTGYG